MLAIQSLVADSMDEGNRGLAFGWLQLTGNIGSILGGVFSVLLAATTVMGIPGWRVSFHLVAAISVVVGVLVRVFATDTRFSNGSMPILGKRELKGSEGSYSGSKRSNANSDISDYCSSGGCRIISLVGTVFCAIVVGTHWVFS